MEEQDSFVLFDDFIKTESDVGTSQTMQNKRLIKPRMFKIEEGDVIGDATLNDLEYQSTEQPVEIKEEMIECEMPKIQGLDLPTKFDQDTVSENVHSFPESIKQELENTSDVKVTDIKQEVTECEYVQPKTENVVPELLTSECDLPTLKIESTDYYKDKPLRHTYSNKQLKNTAPVLLKKKRKKRRYGCPICQNNFPSSKSRSTHIDGHFQKSYAVCQFCGKLMKKIEFFQHIFIHVVKNRTKNYINDLKYDISSRELKQKKIDDVNDNMFYCDICSKRFNRKCTLNRHLVIHSGDKQFKCDTCSKCFNRKSNLQSHLITHSGEKSYKCDICFRCFTQKPYLKQHLLIHDGKKSFKCDICSKDFSQKRHLQQHLIIHSDETAFQCDICFKYFKRKYSLQEHVVIHSAEKPFKCDICTKSFSLKSNLRQHLLIHNVKKLLKLFKCDICSKNFSQKRHLQQHLIVHSDEIAFQCDICFKYFKRKCTLQRHILIHSGKKPFKYDIL